MAENPRDAIGPMNGTINDVMGQPVIDNPIPDLIINGTAVWEDMDEVQAELEATSLEPEDNGSVQAADPVETEYQDSEPVDD